MRVEVAKRTFRIVLIKPSHYDREGYVIRWYRNTVPSNSLATVYAIMCDAARRQVLGPDIDIRVIPIDETNTRVRINRIITDFRYGDGFGFVGLVGVQSNQYPRALDIARPLRAAAIPVIIGGFHVSGMLAMFKCVTPDLREALDMGVSLFSGEAEGRVDQLILAAAARQMQPIYDFVGDLPDLRGTVRPYLPRKVLRRTIGQVGSFDAGRGCPFQCSFCTIINVQGRKSRWRTADDVENIIRENRAQGVYSFFITDDNFARNKNWESIFDRIAEIRSDGCMGLRFIIQVDTLCHRIPNFVDKAKRAGVTRVFIGLENINPANLLAAKKRQNVIGEYRRMLLAWKAAGILTYAGYIIGFPHDTPESVRQDIEVIKKELPVDMLEFSVLTPLPGSEDHKILQDRGVALDADLNKYDIEQVCGPHPKMTASEWKQAYDLAWKLYYAPEHLETVMRRARASGIVGYGLMLLMLWFIGAAVSVENVHPMQAGVLRLKHPSERRPGLPMESAWLFYPRFVWETVQKQTSLVCELCRILRIAFRVARGPERLGYTDQAILSVEGKEMEHLGPYIKNSTVRGAAPQSQQRRGRTEIA
jgi:radical SAM superfamily enzyme YgiQ (UPF0313 family)